MLGIGIGISILLVCSAVLFFLVDTSEGTEIRIAIPFFLLSVIVSFAIFVCAAIMPVNGFPLNGLTPGDYQVINVYTSDPDVIVLLVDKEDRIYAARFNRKDVEGEITDNTNSLEVWEKKGNKLYRFTSSPSSQFPPS